MILAIDPSINNIGFAIKQNDNWNCDTYYTNRELSHEQNALNFAVHAALKGTPILASKSLTITLVAEFPSFFGNQRGAVAAQQGYTLDLAYQVGLIAGYLQVHPTRIYLYRPNQWKGNLHKKAIEARYIRIFGNQSLPSEHAQEATMMLWYHLHKKLT